jgi:hypothetical protein
MNHLNDIMPTDNLRVAGFRFGDKGTHTSRTIMLRDFEELLKAVPRGARRPDYVAAIIEENALGKQTAATRKHSSQRLGELYGLDHGIPLFRVLRHLWALDAPGRPLIALLCTLCRDPLLRATAKPVLDLPRGAELVRSAFLASIRDSVGPRLNDAILDKVARNAASSWSQSGHLEGRVRKVRRRVTPTPGSTAFALWLGSLEGLGGEQLLTSRWTEVLDTRGKSLIDSILLAKQLGLVDARVGGGVFHVDPSRLAEASLEH